MKKLLLIIFVLLANSLYGQLSDKPPKLLDWDGTSKRIWQIGKDAGGLKWDADSLAYKLLFRDENGDLDSMWIALTDYLTGPNKVEFMASELDTLGGRMSLAESSLLLKADIDSVDALVDSIYAVLALKADITMLPDSNYLDAVYSAISLKANVTYIDSLRDTLNTVSAGLIAEAGNRIAGDSTLTANLFLYALRDSIISYIRISPEAIKISADRIELDGDVIADSLFGRTISSLNFTSVDPVSPLEHYLSITNAQFTLLWSDGAITMNATGLNIVGAGISADGYNDSDWNTAYGWGNHASAGYVTGTPWTSEGYVTGTPWTSMGYVGIDSVANYLDNGGYLNSASYIPWSQITDRTGYNSANWDSSYSWGNHALAGYVTGTPWTSMGYIGIDSVANYLDNGGYLNSASYIPWSQITDRTGYNNSNWDTAYGWGNHASAGYASAFTGVTAVIQFTDADGNDQKITITNGVITNWETL